MQPLPRPRFWRFKHVQSQSGRCNNPAAESMSFHAEEVADKEAEE